MIVYNVVSITLASNNTISFDAIIIKIWEHCSFILDTA